MNQIIIGTLARAKQRHEVRVCFFVCLGNHLHLLLWTEDARELAKFMGYFLSKLARSYRHSPMLFGWHLILWEQQAKLVAAGSRRSRNQEALLWVVGGYSELFRVITVCGPSSCSNWERYFS
jgi:REP element-mobilizing transposase RayT